MNETISKVHARQVLDSRGRPTVEVDVACVDGTLGRAIVPSGASTGRHEALELRDGDAHHYRGKGVLHAVRHVNEVLGPAVVGMAAGDQRTIDETMLDLDGTPTKRRLGANAILGVSLATAHAAANARRVPLWQYLALAGNAVLPMPMVNLISGGLHAGRQLEFQDFLFLPLSAKSYTEALEMTVSVYWTLGDVLREHGFEGILVGDEGGFGPRLSNNEQALEIIVATYARLGLKPGVDAGIALDVASTHFYDGTRYTLQGKSWEPGALVELLATWCQQYPILSIEDGMAEDDWDGWKLLTEKLGATVQLIGDDLFVTNPTRLREGIERKVANCVLVKVNQIGTLTETWQVLELARNANYRAVVSARSGETEDSTLADLAVASGAGQIKVGSVARSERLAKYNQLLRIEEALGSAAKYAGWQPLSAR